MSAILLSKLAEPFPESDIEWRIGQAGLKSDGSVWATCLAYIQARAIMDRLDQVVGPENWKVRYRVESAGGEGFVPGMVASLEIRVDGEWIVKEDGAEQTDIEPFKGCVSGALKRAGVPWGIGRYLYSLTSEFAEVSKDKKQGWHYGTGKDKNKNPFTFYWKPPRLPAWALPKGVATSEAPSPASAPSAAPSAPAAQQKAPPAAASSGKKTEGKSLPDRKRLIGQVMAAAGKLNVDSVELGKWATDEFQKPPEKLTVPELSSFLQKLEFEIGRRGEVAS